jgi:hypothetical protein
MVTILKILEKWLKNIIKTVMKKKKKEGILQIP